LPEVAGDAAIYFDPTDKFSMLDSMQKVIYNDELKKQLIDKGIERERRNLLGKKLRTKQKKYMRKFYENSNDNGNNRARWGVFG